MKKKGLIITIAIILLVIVIGVIIYFALINDRNEHVFDKQVVSEEYLKEEATCEHKATYYYSCECGEKGEETFESGETVNHVYENGKYIVKVPFGNHTIKVK